MTREEGVEFVLKQLALLTPRDEIIASLCEKTNMPWAQAEKFIKQVEVENKTKLSRQNISLKLVSSIFSIVLGVALLVMGIIYLLNFFDISVLPNFDFSPPIPVTMRRVRSTIMIRLAQIFIDSIFGRILIVIVGVVFLIGGLVGLVQTAKSWTGEAKNNL